MMAHIHQGKTGEIGQPVTAPLSMGLASSFEYYHLKKYDESVVAVMSYPDSRSLLLSYLL